MKRPLPLSQPIPLSLSLLPLLFAMLLVSQLVNAQPDEPPLETPYFEPAGFPYYEKDILLGFHNPNEGSETEIYIGLTEGGDFALAYIAAPGERIYFDTSRSPRTTYYFKLRAVLDERVSLFSSVTSFTTGSKFYHPALSGDADGTTIELTLRDRSYDDLQYELWREQGSAATFLTSFNLSDSGQVVTYIDADLQENTTYNYRVDARTKGPNQPFYHAVATASVKTQSETQSGPLITGFTLVDPDTDQDMMDLVDHDVINADNRPNIRANANDETQSVVFYLNGVERTENEAPYAYFYDRNGDYRPGRLTLGDYTLEATAYSGNNGQGTRGNTISIQFTVGEETLVVYGFSLIDPDTDTEIAALKDGDVIDASQHPNIRANTDARTNSVVFFLNGVKRTENEKPYAYFYDRNGDYRPGKLSPGNYVLEATAFSGNNAQGESGRTHTIQFTVKENAEEPSFASLDLFPNPIVSDAVLQVTGTPGELVEINVMDTSGNSRRVLETDALDGDGMLRKTLPVGTLPRGNYLLRVSVNGKATVKRFVIQK